MWPLIKLLPAKTNFRFVKYRKFLWALSILLTIGSLVVCVRPGLNLGIDFRGGTILELSTPNRPIDLGRARDVLSDLQMGDVQVQQFGGPSSAQVRFQTPEGSDPSQTTDRVQGALRGALGQDVVFNRTEQIGGKVSDELRNQGLMALGIAILLMMAYIWFRFEFRFGVGAVVGLFHDVILCFGLIAVTRMEFSLTTVAGILTVIGYSMNDTVVVFDRIRENLVKYKRMPMGELIDLSINETFSRTMITGPTALMALAALAVFGGEALFSFSMVLMFGLCFGTYSSIYIGAPILMFWKRKAEDSEPAGKPAVERP
jgi:preprotein translocase subunit SecF/SecD/SecF fusion protein